jgi:hypothetical protein
MVAIAGYMLYIHCVYYRFISNLVQTPWTARPLSAALSEFRLSTIMTCSPQCSARSGEVRRERLTGGKQFTPVTDSQHVSAVKALIVSCHWSALVSPSESQCSLSDADDWFIRTREGPVSRTDGIIITKHRSEIWTHDPDVWIVFHLTRHKLDWLTVAVT